MRNSTDRGGAGAEASPKAFPGLGGAVRLVVGTMALGWIGSALLAQARSPAGGPLALLAGVALALGLLACAGLLLRYRSQAFERLARVETATVVLAAFAGVAVAASLVLQDPALVARGLRGEAAYEAFREAEAAFVASIVYGRRPAVPPSENETRFLENFAKVFGAEAAAERAKGFRAGRGMKTRQAEIQQLAKDHDSAFRALYRFCQVTGLADAYHQPWFGLLMVLLVASLASGAARQVGRKRNLGFMVTHLGFVLLVLGFVTSFLTARRGMLALRVGETRDTAVAFADDSALKLPFQVTLEDFRTRYRQRLLASFEGAEIQTMGLEEPAQEYLGERLGVPRSLFEGRYQVTVLEAMPQAKVEARVVDRADAPARAAARIRLGAPGPEAPGGWLFSDPPQQSMLQDPVNRTLLSLHWEDSRVTEAPRVGTWGTLRCEAEGQPPLEVPVRLGARFRYAGRELEIRRVVRDFASRTQPLAEQPIQNPALEMAVRGADEAETAARSRWCFAWIDFDQLHTPPHPDIRMSYRFMDGETPPERTLRLNAGAAGVELVRFAADGTPTITTVSPGSELGAGVEGARYALERFLTHAVVEPAVEAASHDPAALPPPPGRAPPAPRQPAGSGSAREPAAAHEPGHDHDHDHDHQHQHQHGEGTARPALKVRVEGPQGLQERWLIADDPEFGLWSDGTLSLMYLSDPEKVSEWRSILSVWDGSRGLRQAVRVNQPMSFAGWSMYQTDADAEDPSYSGIQVVHDPGWPLVAAGLLFSMVGILWIFWIEPLVRSRRTGTREEDGHEL